ARDYIASLPTNLFPNMTSLASEFALADPDERFELLLDIFVDGLARLAAASRLAWRSVTSWPVRLGFIGVSRSARAGRFRPGDVSLRRRGAGRAEADLPNYLRPRRVGRITYVSTSPAREPRGLSHARTSFVGRSEAVDKVAGLLTQYRLVTVTGPGGVGKTRLAGEVIRQVTGRFADGVWVAELAAVAEPSQVPATVATVLG